MACFDVQASYHLAIAGLNPRDGRGLLLSVAANTRRFNTVRSGRDTFRHDKKPLCIGRLL